MDGTNETQTNMRFLTGITAGADLRLLQYTAVKRGSTHNTVVGCGAGEAAIGVLYNAPNSGEPAQVRPLDGTCGWLNVDTSTILDGSVVKSDSGGLGTVTTTDNDIIIARAMEANGGVAKRIQVQYTTNAPRY